MSFEAERAKLDLKNRCPHSRSELGSSGLFQGYWCTLEDHVCEFHFCPFFPQLRRPFPWLAACIIAAGAVVAGVSAWLLFM